jgi:hypothetical protein
MENDNSSAAVLRQEPFVLRELLGLRLRDTPAIICPPVNDVLFLALDFGGSIDQIIPQEFSLGISTLDTRLIQSYVNKGSEKEKGYQDFLQTCEFCFGSSTFVQKSKKGFLFGESEALDIGEIQSKIANLIDGRNIILVTHGGEKDLRVLRRLNINLRPIYILDTQKAAQNPLQLSQRPSLKSLLITLGIPFVPGSLHFSGNDAYYTLRCLLMIAVVDTQRQEGWIDGKRRILNLIRGIARSPLPVPKNEEINLKAVSGKSYQDLLDEKRRKKIKKANKNLWRGLR